MNQPATKWTVLAALVLGFAASGHAAPPKPTLLTPLGGGISATPTYNWNVASGASEYTLWVNRGTTMIIQTWYLASAVCDGSTCSVTTSLTHEDGAHTWWVQAKNASGLSPWSDARSFSVGGFAPSTPSPAAPTGTVTASRPTYVWYTMAGATGYDLAVQTAAGVPVVTASYAPTAANCGLWTCAVTPTTTLANGGYKWWVLARSLYGASGWSALRTFTVSSEAVFPVPSQTTPSGTVSSTTPQYQWTDLPGATSWNLIVRSGQTTVIEASYTSAQSGCNGTTCTLLSATALGNGLGHTWWVRAQDSLGLGPLSEGLGFTPQVANAPPGVPPQIQPSAGAGLSSPYPTYIWSAPTVAVDYNVYVTGPFGNIVHDVWHTGASTCAGGVCSLTPTTALPNGPYVWWIRARNAAGTGAWATTGVPFLVSAYGAVGAGFRHSLAVSRVALGFAWGSNAEGALGDGSTEDSLVPLAITGQSSVRALAGGEGFSVLLGHDGRVFTSGENGHGQLGLGTTTPSLTFAAVSGITNAVALAAGRSHVLVLLSNGTVKAFGAGDAGQLGNGAGADALAPVTVSGLQNIVSIAAGEEHSLAVDGSGIVWAWGAGDRGQLGLGTTTGSLVPEQVPGLSAVRAVYSGSAANHSLVVKEDGTAWGFGANDESQLGNESLSDALSPVRFGTLTNVTWLAAGGKHTLATRSNGEVWTAGDNSAGQLGTSEGGPDEDAPVQVPGVAGVVRVAAGPTHSLAITSDGRVFVWGSNENAELGDGTRTGPRNPTALSDAGFTWRTSTPAFSVPPGQYTVDQTVVISAVTPGAVIHYTLNGQDPTESDPTVASGGSIPVASALTLKAKAWAPGYAPSNVASAAYTFKVGIPVATPGGGVYAQGVTVELATVSPEAEIRYTLDGSTPTASSSLYDAPVSVTTSATVKVKAFRTPWIESDTATFSYQIVTVTRDVAAGNNFSLALDETGRVWAWGEGTDGQLGNGGADDSVVPALVTNLPIATAIAAGGSHGLALRPDGTVVAWGSNIKGQIGDGTTSPRTTPVPVPGLTGVIAIAAGASHSLALTSDGRVFSWGDNSCGQAAVDPAQTTQLNSPSQIAGLTGMTAIAAGGCHTLVLAGDGTVRTFGANGAGQLGNGSFADAHVPVTVTGLADVVSIAAGSSHSVAVKSDGSTWAWGRNDVGALGDGGATDQSLPVQVLEGFCEPFGEGNDCNWTAFGPLAGISRAAAGRAHSLALSPSGAIWSWGENAYGALGSPGQLGMFNPRALAGQVPLWDVVRVAGGSDHTVALTASGEVWSWGRNQSGQIGDGTNEDQLSPVAVSGTGMAWMVATPVLTPPAGMFTTTITVSATTETDDATLHYTTNGYDPEDWDEEVPAAGIPLDVETTLKVRAFRSGMPPSNIRTAEYRFMAPTPVLTPPPGAYEVGDSVVVTGSPGASMYYTVNFTEPTESSTPISSGGVIPLDGTVWLRVKAFREAWLPSETGGQYYPTPVRPTFLPAGGTYPEAQWVSLSSRTLCASIHYTLDGTEPGITSPTYNGPILVESTSTVRARSFKAGLTPSSTVVATYVIENVAVAAPVLSPAFGTFASRRLITVTSPTSGATLRYTTNGADPTPADSSIASGATVLVDRSMDLKVRAWVGSEESEVRTGRYFVVGAIAAGADFTLALKANGTVWAFGGNAYGQLGLGTTEGSDVPVMVPGLTDVVAIGAGARHALAVKSNGTVVAWGDNATGALGIGVTGGTHLEPTAVVGLTGVVAVAGGDSHSVALTQGGQVYTFGGNTYGQLGVGGTTPSNTPVPAGTVAYPLADVVGIGAGTSHTIATRSDGAVFTWGRNNEFQLGLEAGDVYEPHQVTSTIMGGVALTGIGVIAGGGNQSLAIRSEGGVEGAVWRWGPRLPSNLPVLAEDLSTITAVAAGEGHGLAVGTDGLVRAWGDDSFGQLGDGRTWGLRDTPGFVLGLTDAVAVAGGGGHSLAIDVTGQVWAWGRNDSGQLGDGGQTTRGDAVPVPNLSLVDTTGLDEDPDQDGLTTLQELRLGTDPNNPDTNGDGVLDGASVAMGRDPISPDLDGDGLSNADEILGGTDLLNADTDGDGVADGLDAFPLDPTRSTTPDPDPSDQTPPTITLTAPPGATLISSTP